MSFITSTPKVNKRKVARVLNMKTLLLREEVEDGEIDYVNIEAKYFEGMCITDLEEEFKTLMKCLQPSFSGSVDHRVNTLHLPNC
jgi:hypothetical protein